MSAPPPMHVERAGVGLALAAYGLWGVTPVYFKWLSFTGSVEVVAHRVAWSVAVLALVVSLRGRWHLVRALSRRQLTWLAVSGGLISVNWLLFLWAVFSERMLDASLGYFINPLVNVLLGVLFFKEWLRPAQKLALLLAAAGVVNEVWAVGVLPWVGLTLAMSFGLYGLVRKRLAVDPVVGLGVESTLVLPVALGYLVFTAAHGDGTLARGDGVQLLLLSLGGPITVVPLVCFAAAAARMPLSVLGFFQYIAPSAMFLLAVFVYDEPFRPTQLVTFGCIWAGLAIFSAEALYHQRKIYRQLRPGEGAR